MGRATKKRSCWPCMALLAGLGHWYAQAADYEALHVPLRREYTEPYRPLFHGRLVFKAPPSQLFEAWCCAWPIAGANSWEVVPWSPYERADTNPYTGYPHNYMQDPFAPLRLMPQPYPLRPPQPRGKPVPGAPPSQLPNDRLLPSDANTHFPQPSRSTP